MARKVSAKVVPFQAMTDEQALAWLRDQGSEVAISQAAMAEAVGWSRTKVGERLRKWQERGYITAAPRGGRRASWIVTGGPDGNEPKIGSVATVATAESPVATVEPDGTDLKIEVSDAVATDQLKIQPSALAANGLNFQPVAEQAPVATTALDPKLGPVPPRPVRRRWFLRTRPRPMPVATVAAPSDDRIAVNGKVANVVVNGLGITAGVFFAWKGYEALGVSLHINMAYAESLAASETAKELMRSAFAVVGYIAAFGAPAVETMLALGHRRAAIGAGVATACALFFGLHAATGFVASHTDATAKGRAVIVARLDAADGDARRAQTTLDRIGVAAWSQADEDELKAKVKTLPGGEKACVAAKPSTAVMAACQRITELREARSNVAKMEAARAQLADAEARRKTIEAEAKTSGVMIGSETNPVASTVAGHVQAATGGSIPLTPKGVEVAGFFFEALAPELAVFTCFWLSGVLLTGSFGALFRRRERPL